MAPIRATPLFIKVKNNVLARYANNRSWSSRTPLLLFESDDWGAIRVQNKTVRDELRSHAFRLRQTRYDELDTLENQQDLEALFEVLQNYRDRYGNAPIFTANFVLGNPDFQAIRNSDFESYSFESLFDSYTHYHAQNLEPLWRESFNEKVVWPQFHAREHLNIGLWLRDLQAGHSETRFCFERNYYGLTTQTSSRQQKNYLAAYWPESQAHLKEIKSISKDGLRKFEDLFGFKSKTTIPCNYILPSELEQTLADCGVRLIQSQRGQLVPGIGRRSRIHRPFTGKRNKLGQAYSVRNVMFEPFENENRDWVDSAMKEIDLAFRIGAPAIVSTHRVNYVGGLDMKHRDRNLRLLDELIGKLLSKWPDVRFITSEKLAGLMGCL